MCIKWKENILCGRELNGDAGVTSSKRGQWDRGSDWLCGGRQAEKYVIKEPQLPIILGYNEKSDHQQACKHTHSLSLPHSTLTCNENPSRTYRTPCTLTSNLSLFQATLQSTRYKHSSCGTHWQVCEVDSCGVRMMCGRREKWDIANQTYHNRWLLQISCHRLFTSPNNNIKERTVTFGTGTGSGKQ